MLHSSGQPLLGETVPQQPAHDSAQQRHQQQQHQKQQQQHPGTLQAGAIPGPPKRRGRPPKDHSQLSEKQLKAISSTQSHLERKRSKMHDLEERVAAVVAELERERAQQESNVQAIAALEGVLHYTEDMVAVLKQQVQGTSASGLHTATNAPTQPAVSRGSSSSSGCTATCLLQPQPLLTSKSATQEEPEQPNRPQEAPSIIPGTKGFDARQVVFPSLTLELNSKYRQFAAVWAHSMPATWRFVEAVVSGQLPQLHEQGGGPAAVGTQAAGIQLQFRQWRLQLEKVQQMPYRNSCQHTPGTLDMWGICAAASPDVVAELQSVATGDIVQGWRDAARRSRDALAMYDVVKTEAWAGSKLDPMHQLWMGIVMKLATLHNPACMRQLLLAGADNLSDEQRREKYDEMVVSVLCSEVAYSSLKQFQAAIDVTPSQQERYLELVEAYTSFVQQLRQHKAESLARIAESAFSSMPASASAGRMVSRYLAALEGASVLSAYPDAELVAAVELVSGMAALTKPLQKVKLAAMAYPHFADMAQVMEAIKRLPPPEQRRQQQLGKS
ncbi:hypothetical protein N2152v2_010201 [Parachlorella kessleri]